MLLFITTAVVAVFVVGWASRRLVFLLIHGQGGRPYPPGPKPKPIIGNMFDFPTTNAAQCYMDMETKYNSPMLHFEFLGDHIIVLNHLEDAIELLEKRARLYSDRPDIPVIKLMGWEYNFGFLPYGERWRQHRRVAQQNLSPQATQKYEELQTKKVSKLLQGLLSTPKEFDTHNKMFAVSLTMEMMYGYEVKSLDDPVIRVAEEAIALGTSLVGPGGSIINMFPILRYIPSWIPGASSHKTVQKVRALTEEMMRIPTEYVKKSFAEGTAAPSFITEFYEKKYNVGATAEEEELVKSIAYTIYGGGSDTTISVAGTFFYVMAISPHVQMKAQAEIDRVIGSKRLPTLADRASLPYIEAIYREVMRFRPTIPLNVPHRLVEDDFYKGYFIPKGTSIVTNIWAMTHHEELYPDPYTFKPERFLDQNGELNDDSRILAYGFGRRACVGKYVASSTIWLLIASILACFNIEKAKDEDGNEIEINHEYEKNNFFNHKSKFDCSFVPRSSNSRKLIQADQ